MGTVTALKPKGNGFERVRIRQGGETPYPAITVLKGGKRASLNPYAINLLLDGDYQEEEDAPRSFRINAYESGEDEALAIREEKNGDLTCTRPPSERRWNITIYGLCKRAGLDVLPGKYRFERFGEGLCGFRLDNREA